jgi:hypothetical protein
MGPGLAYLLIIGGAALPSPCGEPTLPPWSGGRLTAGYTYLLSWRSGLPGTPSVFRRDAPPASTEGSEQGGRIHFGHLPAWASKRQRESRGDGATGEGPDERDPRDSPGSARRALGVRRGAAFSGQLSAEARGAGRRLPGVLPHDSTEPRRARARTPPRQGPLVGPLRGERLDTLLPCSRSPVQAFVVVQVLVRCALTHSAPGRAA